MDMVQTEKLVFEYEKRDEEGNVIGISRAVDESLAITAPGSLPLQSISMRSLCRRRERCG